jgi:hypothetical protein
MYAESNYWQLETTLPYPYYQPLALGLVKAAVGSLSDDYITKPSRIRSKTPAEAELDNTKHRLDCKFAKIKEREGSQSGTYPAPRPASGGCRLVWPYRPKNDYLDERFGMQPT